MAAVLSLPRYDMSTARLEGDALVFVDAPPDAEGRTGLRRAIHDGFFQLLIPDALRELLVHGDRFVASFFLPKNDNNKEDPYTGFGVYTEPGKYGATEGYRADNENQAERFSLRNRDWGLLPSPVRALCEAMNAAGMAVLTAVMRELAVPVRHWDAVTGGAISGAGNHTCLWNHYRESVAARGLKNHKDWGCVTLLRAWQPGLEARINGQWYAVEPTSRDYLVVNFGMALEYATRHTALPVTASEHRVTRQQAARYSYALFLDNDRGIVSYLPATDALEVVYADMEAYVKAASAMTYAGEDTAETASLRGHLGEAGK